MTTIGLRDRISC